MNEQASLIEKAQKLLESKIDNQIRSMRATNDDLKKQLAQRDARIEELERTVNLICLLNQGRQDVNRIVVPKSAANEIVPVIIWSDWHVEERVDPSKTLGKNEFDLKICERRVKKCIESTVKMIRHARSSNKVRSVVLMLGGDFISGDIHQELSETNLLGPAEACVFARNLIANGLQALSEERYLQQIRVVGICGNHGRTTKKVQYKNGAEKSFETIIYAFLASQFNHRRFDWTLARGGVEMLQMTDDFLIRLFHGHQVRYGGGIGGLTIPLTKWIHRQDQTQAAGFNLMGHFHQYGLPTPRCLCNSSIKGWDEYAAEHGFAYEPPQQAGAFFDTVRNRITCVFPIFCQ